jgi:hypothetical protein
MQNDRSKALIDSITDSINTLATMTDATAKSDLFKTWLRAVSRFHHYSFNNQLLVLLQRPQAERVAGFHTWKSLGRNVKKGAKGIAILAPCVRKQTAEEADRQRKGERVSEMRLCGFRVTHVFDIADTEGKLRNGDRARIPRGDRFSEWLERRRKSRGQRNPIHGRKVRNSGP